MLDPLHPLQSSIVSVVAQTPGVTMPLLAKQLRAKKMKVTVPTLYRTVAMMIEANVLVRKNGQLGFAPSWVEELQNFFKAFGAVAPAAPVAKQAAKPMVTKPAATKKPAAAEPVAKKQATEKKVSVDRSQSLLMRTVRRFIGEKTKTAELVMEE
jgi:uncharacterized membrane protein (UPF0182 family)